MIKKKIKSRLIVLLIGLLSCMVISAIDRNVNGKLIKESNIPSKVILMRSN
ncbi:hypothetical protein [Clostridium sp. UBA6640]|uniref:hypothetical protein n=1 Tax=Clostridium sp. UBA6640 TaxID=1946370 RepID=UPI0025BA4AAF|nr:hypothetical protein [Clostridium sp. UBA6640]